MSEFRDSIEAGLPVIGLEPSCLAVFRNELRNLFPADTDADFVKFAEACGARAARIDDPARCRDQLAEALSWDGPAIIECVTDEQEPPYPAKIKRTRSPS